MIVELEYRAPVIVEVDIDTGDVIRVTVDDAAAILDRPVDELSAFASSALDIAEGDAMWPEWRFGF